MTAPSFDPRCLQIMDKLCIALAAISQARGFYTNVAGAGIEPLSFTANDAYPQIVVEEDTSRISDTKPTGYQDDLTLNVFGYLPIDPASGYRAAFKFRDDITAALQQVTAEDFIGADGKQLLMQCAIGTDRSIHAAEANINFIEVAVQFAATYRQFFPPAPGTN